VVPWATEEFFPVGPLGDFSYFSTGCQKWWNLFFPLETKKKNFLCWNF